MITLAEKSHVVQNMGLVDRAVRLLIGVALLSVSYFYAIHAEGQYQIVEFFSFAIALYPIFTGMFGWDPAYAMFHGRTCSDTGRNHEAGDEIVGPVQDGELGRHRADINS